MLENGGDAQTMLGFERGVTTRFVIEARLKGGARRVTEYVAAIYADDLEPYRILYSADKRTDG